MKAELVNLMASIASGAYFNADEVNEKLFDELVARMGKSKTIAGEILRAVNRIYYRWYNDGDIAGRGYGRETVNPAVRYLYLTVCKEEKTPFEKQVSLFYDYVSGKYVEDKEYELDLKALLATAIVFIAQNKLWERSNDMDMWDYKDDELDVEPEDEEEY